MRSSIIVRSVRYPAPHSPRPLTATAITCLAVFLHLMSLFACSDSPSTPDQAPGQSARQQCMARAVFGSPEDSEYILPYPVGASYPLLQTYCGPQNHRDDNQLAYDFTIPFGDPVIAARAGIVRHVTEHFADNDTNRANHNHMFIEHSDGTTAFFAHLVQDSILPEVGDWVEQGELIAKSGTSGGTVAVLHFGVYRTWPIQGGNDVAINFCNADGPLDERGGLVQGATYTALPY
jgi:murein DD-endopeptidase MepM/ murein hydrolase activator NlpD